MTYRGLENVSDKTLPHLGGNVKVGDPFTWCPSVWDYLISRFGIGSAMDLGSGSGNAALYFYRRGIQVVAVEGYVPNVQSSLYPAIGHDLTKSAVITKVDLVHCQEVVEHIEETHLDNLLSSMLTGKIINMTHALPGQLGHHHVNLQPQDYWITHFESRGAFLLEEDTRRIRELAKRDGAGYMASTGLVFANRART